MLGKCRRVNSGLTCLGAFIQSDRDSSHPAPGNKLAWTPSGPSGRSRPKPGDRLRFWSILLTFPRSSVVYSKIFATKTGLPPMSLKAFTEGVGKETGRQASRCPLIHRQLSHKLSTRSTLPGCMQPCIIRTLGVLTVRSLMD